MSRATRVKSRMVGAYETDGTTITDKNDELGGLTLTTADADDAFISFQQAREGGVKDYTVGGTIPHDYSATSLYMRMRTDPGAEIQLLYSPYGNTAPSVAQPLELWTCTMDMPNAAIAGVDEATKAPKATPTLTIAWPCTADPEIITDPTDLPGTFTAP